MSSIPDLMKTLKSGLTEQWETKGALQPMPIAQDLSAESLQKVIDDIRGMSQNRADALVYQTKERYSNGWTNPAGVFGLGDAQSLNQMAKLQAQLGDRHVQELLKAEAQARLAAEERRRQEELERRKYDPNDDPAYSISMQTVRDTWRSRYGDRWVRLDDESFWQKNSNNVYPSGYVATSAPATNPQDAFWLAMYERLRQNGDLETMSRHGFEWVRLQENDGD